jgi:hypothetical protein
MPEPISGEAPTTSTGGSSVTGGGVGCAVGGDVPAGGSEVYAAAVPVSSSRIGAMNRTRRKLLTSLSCNLVPIRTPEARAAYGASSRISSEYFPK